MSTHAGFDTPLCALLGCKYPVIQTAMGWVAGSSLVAATTNAGGFGFLAGATIAADQIEVEILRVKTLTQDRPFGLNFHMFQANAQQLLDLAVKHKVRAVSYGRGPDKKTIGRLRDAGIVCMPTVGALKHAQKAVEMGANVITAATLARSPRRYCCPRWSTRYRFRSWPLVAFTTGEAW